MVIYYGYTDLYIFEIFHVVFMSQNQAEMAQIPQFNGGLSNYAPKLRIHHDSYHPVSLCKYQKPWAMPCHALPKPKSSPPESPPPGWESRYLSIKPQRKLKSNHVESIYFIQKYQKTIPARDPKQCGGVGGQCMTMLLLMMIMIMVIMVMIVMVMVMVNGDDDDDDVDVEEDEVQGG